MHRSRLGLWAVIRRRSEALQEQLVDRPWSRLNVEKGAGRGETSRPGLAIVSIVSLARSAL